jgi:2-alkyl-3-oxoalkanoate reductase
MKTMDGGGGEERSVYAGGGNIFNFLALAGVDTAKATGAIGEPLIAELSKRGHPVVGMTTNEAGAKYLEGRGAEVVIVDAFDAPAVEAALRRSKADVVIDELTSLPKAPSDMPKYAAGDRKLRIEGGG